MRYKDLMDVAFTAEEITQAAAAVTTLEEIFSDLRSSTKEELRRTSKMGLRNETFTMEAITAGQQNPQLIPPGIDLAAVERDRVAREVLAPLAQRIQVLNEKLDHSRKLLGADLYGAARAIYKALQEFGKDAGISELLSQLGQRFKGQRRKAATQPPAPIA